ncbi:Acyl-CoA desaturase [Alternaria tenuissima]|uniref:Acyl-CoA desaturase n=1 Tax=Alternaria tenuissima TaxID=119927 RepID=A0A4Q4PJT0_9PLEO|nr:Acyl-CoA desaturase [Alternaria tenuissima]RYO02942.1 Acyl-CoA desaturase [Alternaria tenuissima]RYO25185.1 Acyl-CoA desaturase [Alternaria tenuissima]RYO56687.1 Acyl-CoA desaturase [Alternaria tenuissima]
MAASDPSTGKPPTPKELHISAQPVTFANWYKKINWLNTTLVVLVPTYGLYLARSTPLTRPTLLWSILYYFMTAFGITGGYHRLWSHRCYSARLPVRLFLAFTGAGAIQGSIRWWSANHRAHHRWTDTMKDPYSVMRGLLFSHIGWMVLNNDPKVKGRTDISDLDSDPIVVFQHRHYGKMLLFAAWISPAMVAGLGWGDWWGGFVYAGIIRACFVQQATFCVNSLAHWIGEQPFDDRRSPRDHVLTALVTMGEGYHNFHHEFPSDYRNAIIWYQYDPTKWLIWIMSIIPLFPLTYDLKTFRSNEIEKGRLQQQQKALDQKRSKLDWGLPLAQLPVISWDDFQAQASANGAALVAIAGVIHDVSPFIADHPGGKTLIKSVIGKDGTAVFNGGVYEHSNAAHNLLSTMRVGILRGGQEVEVWKAGAERAIKDTKGNGIARAGDQITRVAAPVAAAVAA